MNTVDEVRSAIQVVLKTIHVYYQHKFMLTVFFGGKSVHLAYLFIFTW